MFLIHWPHPYWVGPSEVRYVRKHRGGFNAICRSGISDTEAHQRNDGGQAFSLMWSEMPRLHVYLNGLRLDNANQLVKAISQVTTRIRSDNSTIAV